MSEKLKCTSIQCKWESCRRAFKYAKDCYDHVKDDHINIGQDVECLWDNCLTISSSKWNLVNHMNTHIEMVRGICYLCEKQFKWRGDFRRHMKSHPPQQIIFNDAVGLLMD